MYDIREKCEHPPLCYNMDNVCLSLFCVEQINVELRSNAVCEDHRVSKQTGGNGGFGGQEEVGGLQEN